MIHVWVVAPTSAMRIGLRALLQEDRLIETVGDSASLEDWVDIQGGVDVILLADDRPIPAFQAAQAQDNPALLLLTDHPEKILDFLKLPWRTWGLLSLDSAPGELSAAIHALQEGLVVSAPSLLEPAFSYQPGFKAGSNGAGDSLTAREVEVLQFLAQGMANKQIAHALGISEHTVKFHVSAIYAKLGVTNRTEAVRVGFQRGLIAL